MSFNWDLRIPWHYGDTYVTLRYAETQLKAHYHPEYIRRLLAWLHYKDGKVGIGGTWRAGGTQPDRPGFAPEGRSFHQDQAYADGFVGACAVDTVYEDGPDPGDDHDGIPWREVPAQGSAEAARWGVHANVGSPGVFGSESWHIQPVEIDGWQTWWDAGRPAPQPNYPIPAEHDPYRKTEMKLPYFRIKGFADQFKPTAMSADSKARNHDSDVPVLVVDVDMSRAELELVLGYKLTPMPGE